MGCTLFVGAGPPCLTVKPHPDWSWVTGPTVYTFCSCGLLGFFFGCLFWFVCLFSSSSSSSLFCFGVCGGGMGVCGGVAS